MNAADTLRDAKRMLERSGWSQGLNNPAGYASEPWTSMGAHTVIVRSLGSKRLAAIECLAKAIERPGQGSLGICDWESQYGRTTQQVLEAFDRAIEIAGGRPTSSGTAPGAASKPIDAVNHDADILTHHHDSPRLP